MGLHKLMGAGKYPAQATPIGRRRAKLLPMPGKLSSRTRLSLAAFAAFSVWITWQAKSLEGGLRSASGTALVGREPPAFALETTDGRKVSLNDYIGKKNFALIFWASWCGPCRLELPVVKAFYQKARPMRDDFEIFAISLDEFPDAAVGAAGSMHLPFPVLVKGQKVAEAYSVAVIPQMLIVDKSGKVKYGQTGFSAGLEMILAQNFGLDSKRFIRGLSDPSDH
jgi:thiol-disulfide isomerase/thioredoxin